MSKPVILVDMDSIIADFYFRILEMHYQETGEVLDPHYITTWDKKLGAVDMFHYFSQPGFFRNLNVIPGAQRVLKGLHDDGCDIMILSAATLTNAPGEKFEWLSEHYPWIHRDNVFFGKRKELVSGYVFIDDHPGTAQKYMKANPEALVLGIEYPYNRDQAKNFDHLVPSFIDFDGAWTKIDQIIRRTFCLSWEFNP